MTLPRNFVARDCRALDHLYWQCGGRQCLEYQHSLLELFTAFLFFNNVLPPMVRQ
ncbi:hypothetical protein RIEGSTA812A_PEG_421 [invertebrate metagenome]|uniref:Uncharacterized protein n=1 Tax=invertebrate metagenome TaxID=1711999 RepID=A0A484H9W8_9ZZZZ